MKRLITLLFLGNFVAVISLLIQPRGPIHRNFAITCIKELTKYAFDFAKIKNPHYNQLLLTYVITKNLSTPAYEIQQDLLKIVHSQEVWAVEVLDDHRKDFKSYEENCNRFSSTNVNSHSNVGCTKRPVQVYKTQFYIMIVESIDNFNKKFGYLKNISSFDAGALYLIYVSKIESDNSNISTKIMLKLKESSVTNSVLIIPKSLTIFDMYQLRMDNKEDSACFSKWYIELSHQCRKGTFTKHDINIFKQHTRNYFRNCIIKVHAIPLEPFVISNVSGIEIDILHELGKALNISFEIELSEATYHLGDKEANGTWTGFVAPIYNSWHMGIGSIAPENKFLTDFTYSVGYFLEKIVWVVPTATLIPRWRVLMVIFTLELWAICMTVIVGFAVLFYFSKTRKEVVTFKTFEKCFAAAFQLLIGVPVPHQPRTRLTRVCFISLALFEIIINSVYTSSLINYLQNPVSEHQISTKEEIANSDFAIGGPSKYKATFVASRSPYAKEILSRYQTVDDGVNKYTYWLNIVGNNKNLATIGIKTCVNYLVSKKKSILTDRQGYSKVYILPQPLMFQSIGIMMKRGAFAKDEINLIIQKLIIEAGIVTKIKTDYIRLDMSDDEPNERDSSENDVNDDESVTPLSTYHLEGAFAILALGNGFAMLIFILEVIYFNIRNRKKKTL